jgi:hypothetical protein
LTKLPNMTSSQFERFGQTIAVGGMFLFSAFAPHSIAAAEISLAIAAAGLLLRLLATKSVGIRRSPIDLPLWLFVTWTLLSSLFSEERSISIPKLQSICVFVLFYLTQAIVRRSTAVALVSVMILSGAAGSIFSVYDLARGRGVVIESISPTSPLRNAGLQPGDAIWRVGNRRVFSLNDIDEAIRSSEVGQQITASVITRGEHVERTGEVITAQMKTAASPSGISGSERSHRFRASGWTRHYDTFAEILQILAQLSLGLAFANFFNHGPNLRFKLATVATIVLGIGIGLTAMRTALAALAIGAGVIALRAARSNARVFVSVGIAAVLAFGAFVVWQTRAEKALLFGDDSSSLRLQIARAGLERIVIHPLLGHGMDAVKLHWKDWGFPGDALIHFHSTPLQLAFDRGLPALALWLWLMFVCWKVASRGEKETRDSGDTNRQGVLLGATGALVGFFVSSLVNYNWGDGEVALVFWWLMGVVIVLSRAEENKPATA